MFNRIRASINKARLRSVNGKMRNMNRSGRKPTPRSSARYTKLQNLARRLTK